MQFLDTILIFTLGILVGAALVVIARHNPMSDADTTRQLESTFNVLGTALVGTSGEALA